MFAILNKQKKENKYFKLIIENIAFNYRNFTLPIYFTTNCKGKEVYILSIVNYFNFVKMPSNEDLEDGYKIT